MSQRENSGKDSFYRAFEDRYRGSRDLIKGRLEVYLPFVDPLSAVYSEVAAVDLGCGRGEWLELMGERGYQAVGVDLDEGMLSVCVERGLDAARQEATVFLRSLPDESQCVVSGFHIAEHIPFADLQIVVEEALRVLKPGGLLILETPNPENIVVGTSSFYLDPTHQRPIPPLLLEFLPENSGFERVKILRLQEPQALIEKEGVDLSDVFWGASPDYSVVAQKFATASIMAVFDEPFARPYGIELAQLANRFDANLDRRFDALERRISGAENAANQTGLVLDRFGALHEKLMVEAVRAERNGAKTALIAEQLCGANLRLRAVEGELATVRERAAQFEARAVAAETFVGELDVRLEAAERRAEDLEYRAVAAESEAAEQECRAGRAQAFIEDLELRVVEAETRAQGLEVHAVERDSGVSENACSEPVCEIQLAELKRRVVAALMQLQEHERRAIAAETQVGELEYQVFEAEGNTEALECRATVAEEKAAEASSQVLELQGRLVDVEARAIQLEQHCAELEARVCVEEQRAAFAERSLAATNDHLTTAMARIAELTGHVSDAELRAAQLEQRAVAAEAAAAVQSTRAAGGEARATQLEDRVASADLRNDELEQRFSAAEIDARNGWAQADRWHERILAIHQSNSWRLTAPIRAVKRVIKGDFSPAQRAAGLITKGVRRVLRPPAVVVARAALSRPMLRYKVSTTLRKYPGLRQHVALFVRNAGLVPETGTRVPHTPPEANSLCVPSESIQLQSMVNADISNLSAAARQIYADLNAAIKQNKRQN